MLKLTRKWPRGGEGRELHGLTVTFDERQRHKFRTRLDNGLEAAVALPRGETLNPGDILASDDETLVEVRAAAERLSLVRCPDPRRLAALCYHLGGMQIPVQIDELGLSYPQVPAVDLLVRSKGYEILPVTAAFDPQCREGCGL